MSSTDKHAELIDAGWSVRLDGLWRSPNQRDLKAYTLEAAWDEHQQQTKRDLERAGLPPAADADELPHPDTPMWPGAAVNIDEVILDDRRVL